MLQFPGEQYSTEELKYIHSALHMIQVSGDQARMLVNLQDKTLKYIKLGEKNNNLSQTTPPGKRK